MRVSLFITCYNDTLFPETGKAVVKVLQRLGHEIVFPWEQTCCGQMHWNTGYLREAVPIIRHFVNVFSRRRSGLYSFIFMCRDDSRSLSEGGA